MSDSVESTAGGSQDEDLAYGGVCPVCGDEFTDGFDKLEQGESREDVRVCVVELEDGEADALFHLPDDQEDDAPDSLKLGPALTEVGHTAGLSLVERRPGNVPTARYQPSVLKNWAEAMEDVEQHVSVSVAPVERPLNESDMNPREYALYAEVPDSEVIAFAAPLLPNGDDEDDETQEVTA